jgi:ABC-type oligopeptide transport system ATPase subunit
VGGLFGGPDVTALQPVTFRLSNGAPNIISIVGQSASGKTTLARIVLGFEKPSAGRICYRGRDLRTMDASSRRVETALIDDAQRVRLRDLLVAGETIRGLPPPGGVMTKSGRWRKRVPGR